MRVFTQSTFSAASISTSALASSGVVGAMTGPETKTRARSRPGSPWLSRSWPVSGSSPRLTTVVTP